MGRVKKKLGTILMFLVLLIGIGLMAYPTVSNWWNSFHQSRAINSYAARVEEMDPELIEQMLIEAHAYNARLAAGDEARYDEASHTRYMSLLGPAGDGVMGYIEIDKIGVKLPVAHTVEESVLQRSVGHLEGSSLPVGGEGTHAVLSGHRGYSGQFSVTYTESLFAPCGASLFPVQLVEAVIELGLGILLLLLSPKLKRYSGLFLYLMLYSLSRFSLEFLRYDEIRGGAAGLSTSQLLSIFLFVSASFFLIKEKG